MVVPSYGPSLESRRDLAVGQKPWMNPMHREATGSAGLHLFQELSTLDQQLARTPLLDSRLGRIKPMLPARRASGIFRWPSSCSDMRASEIVDSHS